MDLTRRARLYVALGVALAVVAVLVADPRPLLGTAGFGAALIAAQIDAVRGFSAARDDVELSVTPGTTHTRVGRAEPVSVRVDRSETDVPIEVTLRLPVGVEGPDASDRTLELDEGAASGELTVEAEFTTAGTFAFPPVEVDLRDKLGFVTERIPLAHETTVTVEPEAVSEFHVGRGGQRVASAYGEHPSDETGAGLTPAELRQYVSGDPAQWIDWKSTARLSEPYVREFEIETDRRTALFVDARVSDERQREGTAGGPRHRERTTGPNVRAYLREAALAIAGLAEVNSDPLGLWIVEDDGYSRVEDAARSGEGYARVRDAIHDLPVDTGRGAAAERSLRRPAEAAQMARSLAGDDSRFARVLSAYTGNVEAYVSQITDDPLFEAIRDATVHGGTNALSVIVTDDSDPDRLIEAAKSATSGGNHALVLCAPRVLFELGGLADLDAAYREYLEFEEFRRDLERLPRVTALEVGPGDRIDALLAAQQAGDRR